VTVKAVDSVTSIEERLGEVNRSVSNHTAAFAALVNERSAELQNALRGHGNILRDALSENAREAEEVMATSTSRILNDVTTALSKLNDSNLMLQHVLDASTTNLATLETSIAQQTANYAGTMREAMGQTEEAGILVGQHVGALQQTIRSMVDEFASILGRLDVEVVSMNQASRALESTSGSALETLEERRGAMEALAESFASRADDIDGRMRMFAQSIADTVQETERRLISARRAMDEALQATSFQVTDTLGQSTQAITQALETATTSVNDALYSTNERFTQTLGNNAAQVDGAVQRAAEAAAAALSQTSTAVRSALAGQANQVNAALEENANKVSDLLSSTAGSVTDVLTTTTSTLADTIADSTQSVRGAIASNTGQLRQAVDQSTDIVRKALDETTEEVTGRLGDFRETADGESRRTNAALQDAQRRLIAEMQQAIEDATHRFGETARAMRETAREVGGELEATRAELARGVNELPEETRASAAAMRRVVAEQIEALSELNAIVRNQPATHDVTDRRASSRAALRQPDPAPRQPEPAQAAQPLVDPIRARPAEQPAAVAQAPAQAPAPAPAPAAPQAAPAPRAEAQAQAGEGGWLRDVLRNASAKQAGAQAPQGLSTLTEEIARAIDDGALAEAWGRYQAGESNVFSRRIYTLTGQGTYDEVRKRLQRDADFMRTAQAYMSDFEQLLKRAAAGPRPAAETREYLLSDRGKVYTTLAHASGRLS